MRRMRIRRQMSPRKPPAVCSWAPLAWRMLTLMRHTSFDTFPGKSSFVSVASFETLENRSSTPVSSIDTARERDMAPESKYRGIANKTYIGIPHVVTGFPPPTPHPISD